MAARKPGSELRLQRHFVRGIRRVVGERDQMDARNARKMPEQVKGSDLVAPVGRERYAMAKKDDLLHPSPRDSIGPMKVATGSGSFFQSSILRRYLASFGLTARRSPRVQ